MKNKRYILGIHSGHDASACLFRDTELCGAIEKERLTRIKHDHGEPIECIEYLLENEKITYQDIDIVIRCNWYNSDQLNNNYYTKFRNVIVNMNHHLFHAYAVSLLSQDEETIICVFDGRGCRPQDTGLLGNEDAFETESIYKLHDNQLSVLEKYFSQYTTGKYQWGSHVDSLGYAFADVSRCIFQSHDAAGKVMALAALGEIPYTVPPVCNDVTSCPYKVNPRWLEYLNSHPIPVPYESTFAKTVSKMVQESTEAYCLHRIQSIIQKYKIKSLSLAGGFALNCKNNGSLFNKLKIKKLNIFPASGDNGLSIGCAVWAIREIYKDFRLLHWSPFLGKKYRDTEIQEAVIFNAVKYLSERKLIGLFELGSEYGPRALCHRSIIADPAFPEIKDILNKKKGRELFRPFGGVILARNVCRITKDRIANDWMLAAVNIDSALANDIPSLIHYDGTVRIQIVRDQTSLIYALLEEYEKRTGKFILINTSFNCHNEPIVESENQARETAKKIGLDYLIISGYGERISHN